MSTATLTEIEIKWTQIKAQEAREQAEFDRIVTILRDLDRRIEETEDDLKTQFGYVPAAGQNDGYARAYRDRVRAWERSERG